MPTGKPPLLPNDYMPKRNVLPPPVTQMYPEPDRMNSDKIPDDVPPVDLGKVIAKWRARTMGEDSSNAD